MSEPLHRDDIYHEPGTIYQPYTTAVLEVDDAPTEVIGEPDTGERWPRWFAPIATALGAGAVILVLWLVLAGAHRGLLPAVPQSNTDTAVSVVYQTGRLTLPPAPVAVPAITAAHTPGVRPVVVRTHARAATTPDTVASATASPVSTPPPPPPVPPTPPPTPPGGGVGGTGMAAPSTAD